MNHDKTFPTLGVDYGTHKQEHRVENDFYSTDPKAINALLEFESFDNNIWECACGNGVLSQRLKEFGYNVTSTDIVNRGYPGTIIKDFLKCNEPVECDIITNPPYSHVTEFILKALQLTKGKVAMFLKIQFLESIKRYNLIFKNTPPARVYIFSKRIACHRNGDLTKKGGPVCYCWYVWDKTYIGEPIIRWIPPE